MIETEKKQLNEIEALLKDAGYDPYSQFMGYLETGDDSYITRKGNARQMIKLISIEAIKEYLDKTMHQS